MSGIVGQNTLLSSGLIKSPAGGGAWNFIKKLTASASGTLSFVDGASDVVLDNTYKEYMFTFNNMHPSADGDGVNLIFNLSIDSGSNYNVTKTTSAFRAYHTEAGAAPTLEYYPDLDLAQSTAFQKIVGESGGDNDQSISGTLHLFNPSSTTFVKHFMTNANQSTYHNLTMNTFTAGYGNTTSAVDAVQFKFADGDIDAGDICLYGITT